MFSINTGGINQKRKPDRDMDITFKPNVEKKVKQLIISLAPLLYEYSVHEIQPIWSALKNEQPISDDMFSFLNPAVSGDKKNLIPTNMGIYNPDKKNHRELFTEILLNEKIEIKELHTMLKQKTYEGTFDLLKEFGKVNSNFGAASAISFIFDSSHNGIKTLMETLLMIIDKVENILRSSPNTVADVEQLETATIAGQLALSPNIPEELKITAKNSILFEPFDLHIFSFIDLLNHYLDSQLPD
tara:strand:- start:898 stop:1626 length:729 start_codon:yes stop_codon:yes gene_type:complete